VGRTGALTRRSIGARLRAGLTGGAVAGVLSGAPSTLHALVTGRSPVESVSAAGTLLPPMRTSDASFVAPARIDAGLVARGLLAHASLSLGWGALLGVALPRRHPVLAGAAAGLAIAAFDLGIVGRRFPRIRALTPGPQVADHVAFGAVVGLVLSRLAASARRAPPARSV
jgi:hypothetical protein